MVKKIGWIALLALILIQFIRIDKTNPEVIPENDLMVIANPPDDVKLLLQSACYDCHSNTTKYPWYTNIAPVSFWIKGHIKNGRAHLNFSEWATYSDKKQDHKLEECIEYVEEGWMPLKSYTWAHSNARLSEDDRQRLVAWFQALRS